MKLSGKFYKRSATQVYVDVSTDAIGLVWIDKDKTFNIDWNALPPGDRIIFDVSVALYRRLKGEEEQKEPQQGELFSEESEL